LFLDKMELCKHRGTILVRESSEIRVLVAESQVDLNRLISTYLDGKDNIRIIESVNDGKTAYDKILELKPDIALVAIIMPVLDGLAIMEKYVLFAFMVFTSVRFGMYIYHSEGTE
jgi:PleD family two-component response regulator